MILDKVVDEVEGAFYGAKDLANMNQMMIIDKMTAKMNETAPFKGTNASVEFQNFMYALAALPMDVGTDVMESVAKVEGTVEKFQNNVRSAGSDDANAPSND